MPPRSLKSISASVAFPAFILGRDPSRRIICVSYSAELAKKHSNDFRAVLEAPWYRSVFPTARIGPYKNSETEIELTARGFRLATSVGGIPEVVVEGQTGLLVRPGDAPALAERILALLSDNGRRRAMGMAARERVRRDFAFASTSRQYHELFQRLLNK